MSVNNERSSRSTPIGLVAVLLAYSAWVVWLGFRHGVFVWGAMADYGLYPYVLVLGLLCSGFVSSQCAAEGSALGLRGSFLALFFGFGIALQGAQPVRTVPTELRWLFDFVGLAASFAVIAAGIVLEKRVRRRV